jgi:hypothetical protein
MASRAGSLNKNKERLLNALKKEYGEDFEPVMQMAKNASRLQKIADDLYESKDVLIEESAISGDVKVTDKITTAVIAQSAWGKVAKFTTPELKAIEISGALDVHELTHDEWLDQLDA